MNSKLMISALPILLVLLMSSCTTFVMIPREDPDTQVSYIRGDAFAVSDRDSVDLFSYAEYQGNQILLVFTIANPSENVPLAFDEGSFTLHQGPSALGPWSELEVFEARDYFRRRKSQIRTAQVLTIISASLQATNTGYSTSTVSGYTSSGTYYSARVNSYNPGLAAIEQQQIYNNASNYIAGGEAELAWLESNLLFPSVIGPGSSYSGALFAQSGKRSEAWYRLSFSIGGERDEIIIFRDEY
jgi:hypothetical protein